MAIIENWTVAQTAAWEDWVSNLAPKMRVLCFRFPPNHLYRLRSSGHRCTVKAYSEDGTLTVAVTGTYNAVMFNRIVFGIAPADLEECDLPGKEETLGVVFKTQGQVDAYVGAVKTFISPDPQRPPTKH